MYRNGDHVLSDVQTVVSEIVTNAVRARCRRLSLALDGHHGYVHIAAADDAPGEPVKRAASPEDSHGRGLHVIEALSSRWGFHRENGAKTVWAEVPLSGDL